FGSFHDLLATPPDEIYASLINVDGFGEERARAVRDYFADEKTRAMLERLRRAGVDPVEHHRAAGGPLAGKKFAITGTLTQPRDEIKAAIEAAGGKVVASVGKSTDFLVAGANTGEAKKKGAEKFGTKLIDEAELARMIAGAGDVSA